MLVDSDELDLGEADDRERLLGMTEQFPDRVGLAELAAVFDEAGPGGKVHPLSGFGAKPFPGADERDVL